MRSTMQQALSLCLSLVILGCATAHDPADDGSVSAEESGDAELVVEDLTCRRLATVAVVVNNQSSMDLQIRFGSYPAARPAPGFTKTIYHVPRVHLEYEVRLEILRGGLQVGPDQLIPTEPVFCNDATLVIGSRPQYSIFYGDKLFEPVPARDREEEGEEEEEEAAEAPVEAPPDSADSADKPVRPPW